MIQPRGSAAGSARSWSRAGRSNSSATADSTACSARRRCCSGARSWCAKSSSGSATHRSSRRGARVAGKRTFVDGLGRVLGAILVGLLGAMLISSGQPALGLSLWLAWAAVPGLRALLAWESRAAETDADRAAISAGLAWQLLDGLESLAHVEAAPCGALRLLVRPGAPIHKRIQRLWSAITAPEPAP